MNIDDIKEASKRISCVVKNTALIESNISCGCKLFLKPENLQVTGSFKIRGAFNKMSLLTASEKEKGIIACSAGNHAQGVALTAQKMGIKAIICMPKSAPKVKIDSTIKYGAKVVFVDGTYDDSYEEALKLKEEYGYTFVHPFNDEDVMKGQGTIGLEIMNELNDADIVVCSIGGGGLISGVSLAVKEINPNVKVYGIQAHNAPSMYASLAKGYVTKIHKGKTIADGINVKEVANETLMYTEKYVDDVITVTEEEIIKAIKKLYEEDHLVVEGAGAATVAGVLANKIPNINNKKVVCVLSGGNIDEELFNKIIRR